MREQLTKLLHSYAAAFNLESVEEVVARIVGAALIFMAGFLLSRALQKLVVRRSQGHDSGAPEVIESYRRIIRIVVMGMTFGLALHTLGVNLAHVFTAGGLFAVAAAFAMKNVSENLIAGTILRFEQVIKRGDVLRISTGEMVKVKRIGPRATIVRSKSEADLIIPNSMLVQNEVYNDTHDDALHRLEARIGVAYASDLHQVRSVLEQACNGLDWRSQQKEPVILLTDFGDSTVNYLVLVWIDDPWIEGRMLSTLNEAIWWALKDAGIVIAFPQLDVHVVHDDPE